MTAKDLSILRLPQLEKLQKLLYPLREMQSARPFFIRG